MSDATTPNPTGMLEAAFLTHRAEFITQYEKQMAVVVDHLHPEDTEAKSALQMHVRTVAAVSRELLEAREQLRAAEAQIAAYHSAAYALAEHAQKQRDQSHADMVLLRQMASAGRFEYEEVDE